jgi:triacylglycerol lipase
MSPFTNEEAAKMALLAMYAEDTYETAGKIPETVVQPKIDPRVAAAGWDFVAYITAQDAILDEKSMGLGKTVFYGFLARSVSNADQYIAVIRGTEGIVEWIEDAEFTPVNHPLGGKVEDGFFSIYSSMEYLKADGTSVPVAAGIAQEVSGKQVTVIGHSLGSAIATYLTLDLAVSRKVNVSACLFASPRTGNLDFVNHFDQSVATYAVYDYWLDLVPTVPGLFGYSALPKTTKIAPNVEVIRVSPACNHHAICYAQLLFPSSVDVKNLPEVDVNCAACIR